MAASTNNPVGGRHLAKLLAVKEGNPWWGEGSWGEDGRRLAETQLERGAGKDHVLGIVTSRTEVPTLATAPQDDCALAAGTEFTIATAANNHIPTSHLNHLDVIQRILSLELQKVFQFPADLAKQIVSLFSMNVVFGSLTL